MQIALQPPAEFLINRISGLVVEYIVAIDVTRVRFPADAHGDGLWPGDRRDMA